MKLKTNCNILTKKNAVILLIILASVLAAIVIAISRPGGFGFREIINVGTAEGREKYLNSLGWEIDAASEEQHTILIPAELDGVMEPYAKMQDEQGFDFSSCRGTEATLYSYVVTNYPNYNGTVFISLYVRGCRVIGGDVHAAELNGFIHGIK